MKHVTIVRAYYENPATLRQHLDELATMPTPLLSWLSMIVADDGSPDAPAEQVLRDYGDLPVPVRLFRMDVDVRWNWLGARNVAMHYSEATWHLITDMDHHTPETTLRSLVTATHDANTVYRLSRLENTRQPIHPHPNSWFMTREMFWKIGGFNEAASGFYGTDGDYRRRVAKRATVVMLDEHLIRREKMGDASTRRYKRKQPEDVEGKRILRQWGDRPPRVLSFPHHEVAL